jgi:hypothetical protein
MSAEKKTLKKGRFIKESGESTLESDVEAAQVRTLNSFAPQIEALKAKTEKLKGRIQEAKEVLENGEETETTS